MEQEKTPQQIRQEEVAKFQSDSFPSDPILLLKLTVYAGHETIVRYALPKDVLVNPDNVMDMVFFDVIEGDKIVEKGWSACPIEMEKVVFSRFKEVENEPTLTIFDHDLNALRASRVLKSLPGINLETIS